MEGFSLSIVVLISFVLLAVAVYILARFVFTAYFRAKKDFLCDLATNGKDQDNGEEE